MIDYSTPMGLLKRWDFETEPENSFLYALQAYMLGEEKYLDALIKYMVDVQYKHHSGHLIFNNHVDEHQVIKTPFTSHDQLTAYTAFNAFNAGFIWDGIKYMKGSYDNINVKFNIKRILHPRDLIFFGIMGDSLIAKLFSPLLYLMGVYTYLVPKRLKKRDGKWKLEKKNSNEILWWLRMKVLPNGPLKFLFGKLFDLLVKIRFGNYTGLFIDYYVDENHPVVIAAKKANV